MALLQDKTANNKPLRHFKKMAKYDITYSCGHEGTVSLFGKMSDRERQLARYSCGVCPDCYRKKKDEENKKAGIILTLTVNRFNDSVMVVASGDTYNHKEELKELGFIFGEVDMGASDGRMWGIYIDCASVKEFKEKYAAIIANVRAGVSTQVTEKQLNRSDALQVASVLEKTVKRHQQAEEIKQKKKEEEAVREELARQEAENKALEEKNKWKRVAIPAECARNIGGFSKNIRIKFPKESRLAGYSFIVGNYRVFEGSHAEELYLELYRNFSCEAVKLKRLDKKNKDGKRYELVDPITITRQDVIECFGNEVDPDAPKTEQARLIYDDREETITHVPEPLEPIEGMEARKELLREGGEQ